MRKFAFSFGCGSFIWPCAASLYMQVEATRRALFNPALLIVAVCSVICAQEGQLRLSPSEIKALASANAGAGTSGVNGIQTRALKGDATKPGTI
jgi:hypothetical protein